MDWVEMPGKINKIINKNKYLILILVVGIIFMLFPGIEKPKNEETVVVSEPEEIDVEQRLEDILSQIKGAGRVKLLLTQASGKEIVYQTDESRSEGSDNGNIRTETVMVTGADRIQTGLVSRIDPPSYLGAVVVCQGADQPSVRLAVVDAICDATGLTTDKITVIKMK